MAHGHKIAKLKPANHQNFAICQLQNYPQYGTCTSVKLNTLLMYITLINKHSDKYHLLGRAKASPTKARKRLFVCTGIPDRVV